MSGFNELVSMDLVYHVPVANVVEHWDYIDTNTAQVLALQIVEAMANGEDYVIINDQNLLERMGIIRTEYVSSETNHDVVYYVVERRMAGGWVKMMCSCRGFNAHGHCKHSLG